MSEEILINLTPMETRVAVVENGMLQEVYIERAASKGIVGNIYKGKVVRVLPGMQAAFVDTGLERASFIHASDIAQVNKEGERRNGDTPDIRSLLREGQSIITQVIKDPMGTKGARLTTHLSVPSRYLVFMPGTTHLGISQRIDDEEERSRLRELVEKAIAEEEVAELGGFIIRTAAEGAQEEELHADIRFFKRLWAALERKMKERKAPSIIYEDLPLHMRTMRDLIRPEVEKIRIDSRETYETVKGFTDEYIPEIGPRVEYYPGPRPIFDLYAIEDEMQKALGRKVELKSGGYLIFDQTEAMTTIDVNTGAFVGHRNQEETIYKTNLEAATTLARQLKIRNLGGIIIIDFIDMKDAEHKRQVHRALEKAMAGDHAKTAITGVSELGLVEMTRKRTRESLEHVLCEACPVCEGRGSVKTPETICYEIFREILREARAYENDALLVLASQAVVDRLLDEESASVADLEEFIGKAIRFQVEIMYSQEQFDVILL
ncbi:ribonuclease G [Dasania sp. GY-MA-18]|uniref:Ribonuclease G n=1 Tax=Dasania phycosphaerae TaxID=2950436 RepID=A0A9J6RHS7_9GAMM|nr:MULTISPECIES: ribonuclease G [Dasania]MCR8921583.1 ribonuclease G [Dasania sp. GY-MA-18]MCZ0864011.1 ribonuclease G [Dasania phycosphaerae]MCZ0867739.1 ribonuclease G [Dasania phycosphaerae]